MSFKNFYSRRELLATYWYVLLKIPGNRYQ